MKSSMPRSRTSMICMVRSTYLFLLACLVWFSILSTWHKLAEQQPSFDVTSALTSTESREILEELQQSTHKGPRHEHKAAKQSVAVVVTITDCTEEFPIIDAAAVLQYSLNKTSVNGPLGGTYAYTLYAVYHPDAETCALPLELFGYTLLKRPVPVSLDEIQGEYLRVQIEMNGCCGAKELIKFEAFTLTQHDAVVLVDLDVLFLKPLDPLLDLLLDRKIPGDEHLQWRNKTIPDDILLLYTVDYNMVSPDHGVKPVQGGFVLLRPSSAVYDDIVDIVRHGDFRPNGGWSGRMGNLFWGGATFQGLMPYYFSVLVPGYAVELNRCTHANMAMDPRHHVLKPNATEYECLTQEETCEDCRHRSIDSIYSIHFTNCLKPWVCPQTRDPKYKVCRDFHHAWFAARSEMEQSWGRTGIGSNNITEPEHFLGYCDGFGRTAGYERLQAPYKQPMMYL
jgi:hypothetical protein